MEQSRRSREALYFQGVFVDVSVTTSSTQWVTWCRRNPVRRRILSHDFPTTIANIYADLILRSDPVFRPRLPLTWFCCLPARDRASEKDKLGMIGHRHRNVQSAAETCDVFFIRCASDGRIATVARSSVFTRHFVDVSVNDPRVRGDGNGRKPGGASIGSRWTLVRIFKHYPS